MNIGLLSMQRVNNYGSFWQAFCLKTMLEKKGDHVEFIDIKPGKRESITVYKKHFTVSKIKRIPYYILQKKKEQIFEDFQIRDLHCSTEVNYREDYDSIMIGSDEVFNFAQKSPWGFSTQLYGDMNNANINTYAASFGNTTLADVEYSGYGTEIVTALSKLKAISVRDENSYHIIKELMAMEPDIHLDPVVVGDLILEKKDLDIKNTYILVYSYDFRLSDRDVINQVKELAKKEGLKILSIGFYQNWVDRNIIPTPVQLLNYFYNAKYILTDTFHGTIFAIRMHKQFVTIVRETNKQKLNDLLHRLKFENRQYINGDSIGKIMHGDIHFDDFEDFRARERQRTETYLNECIR